MKRIHLFIFIGCFISLADKTSGQCNESPIVVINEFYNGFQNAEQEYVELLVLGDNGATVDLSGFIIDDNNYAEDGVGRQQGHIRLGSCFSEMHPGDLIVLYDSDTQSPTNSTNTGIYFYDITDPCIEKHPSCPSGNSSEYACGSGSYPTDSWELYIPMHNHHDGLFVRDRVGKVVDGVYWGTSKVLDEDGSAYNLGDVYVGGESYSRHYAGGEMFRPSNPTFGDANSLDNQDLISNLRSSSNSPLILTWEITKHDTGSGDGEIALAATGGVPPYRWEVSEGSIDQISRSSANLTNLTCSSTQVTLKDARGCIYRETVSMFRWSGSIIVACAEEQIELALSEECNTIEADCISWTPANLFSDPTATTQIVSNLPNNTVITASIIDKNGNYIQQQIWMIDAGADQDEDGICDHVDNCVSIANTAQNDEDEDGIGDACDDPGDDTDGDGIKDWLDPCPLSANNSDTDGDGVCDYEDNCIYHKNPDQNDSDGDKVGDACDGGDDTDGDGINDLDDGCPFSYTNADQDGDGICDENDNCPNEENPGQEDEDGDGIGDACDTSVDTDGDGILDVDDPCPYSANNQDTDGDGICDYIDNCPLVANRYQEDSDGDTIGDACDGGDDTDGDGINDNTDPCPRTHNNVDSDGDGVCDDFDNCPSISNRDQADSNGNGVGDACDDNSGDVDQDGIPDYDDNCLTTPNTDQSDTDGDGIGDACDDPDNDVDNDGIPDDKDNCPSNYNPNQEDSDSDGIGDACEDTLVEICGDGIDNDGDGLADCEDPDCIDFVPAITEKYTCPGECVQLYADQACGSSPSLLYTWIIDGEPDPSLDGKESVCIDILPFQNLSVRYSILNSRNIEVGSGEYVVKSINQEANITSEPGSVICNGEEIELTVEQAWTDISWTFEGTEIANTKTISVSQEGIYTVTGADYGGCIYTGSIEVSEINSTVLQVALSDNGVICNEPVTATVTNEIEGLEIIWINETTGQDYPGYEIIISEAGEYRVYVDNAANCIEPNKFSIYRQISNITITPEIPVDCGTGVSVSVEEEHTGYLWRNIATGEKTPGQQITLDAGMHSVTVTDINNCTAEKEVEVLDGSENSSVEAFFRQYEFFEIPIDFKPTSRQSSSASSNTDYSNNEIADYATAEVRVTGTNDGYDEIGAVVQKFINDNEVLPQSVAKHFIISDDASICGSALDLNTLQSTYEDGATSMRYWLHAYRNSTTPDQGTLFIGSVRHSTNERPNLDSEYRDFVEENMINRVGEETPSLFSSKSEEIQYMTLFNASTGNITGSIDDSSEPLEPVTEPKGQRATLIPPCSNTSSGQGHFWYMSTTGVPVYFTQPVGVSYKKSEKFARATSIGGITRFTTGGQTYAGKWWPTASEFIGYFNLSDGTLYSQDYPSGHSAPYTIYSGSLDNNCLQITNLLLHSPSMIGSRGFISDPSMPHEGQLIPQNLEQVTLANTQTIISSVYTENRCNQEFTYEDIEDAETVHYDFKNHRTFYSVRDRNGILNYFYSQVAAEVAPDYDDFFHFDPLQCQWVPISLQDPQWDFVIDKYTFMLFARNFVLESKAIGQQLASIGSELVTTHAFWDAAAMIPVIGVPLDIANAIWYFAEGKNVDAFASLAGIVCDVAPLAKTAGVFLVAGTVGDVQKIQDGFRLALRKATGGAGELLDAQGDLQKRFNAIHKITDNPKAKGHLVEMLIGTGRNGRRAARAFAENPALIETYAKMWKAGADVKKAAKGPLDPSYTQRFFNIDVIQKVHAIGTSQKAAAVFGPDAVTTMTRIMANNRKAPYGTVKAAHGNKHRVPIEEYMDQVDHFLTYAARNPPVPGTKTMIAYMKNGVSNQVDAAAQTIRRLKEIDPCPTCLIQFEPKLSKGAADEILTDATSVGDIRYLDFPNGPVKLGEFKSWGKGTVQRAFKNNKIIRQLTDYFRNPIVDDISNVVYDFDGRKLLEGITDNAGHYASKGEAELFIKGELSKVLVTKDVAGNLIPSEKAFDLVEEMNGQLKGELGLILDEPFLSARITELFENTNSVFYSFIKVH